MATKNAGKYIGDAGITQLLRRHGSDIPFYVVRMRVLGAIASPYKELLPAMVIASFWPEDKFPRHETKQEVDAFFESFMGLWQRVEKLVAAGNAILSAPGKLPTQEDAKETLLRRMEELESGFIEGFWGGQDDLAMSSAGAALIDGLSDQAESYHALYQEIEGLAVWSDSLHSAIQKEVQERDEVVEDSIRALLLLKDKMGETVH